MKNNFGFLTAWISSLLLLAGCGLVVKDAGMPAPAADGPPPSASASNAAARSGGENAYFLFMESKLAEKRGDMDAAAALLRQALVEDPESEYLRKELAVLYLQKQEHQNALAVVEELLERNPESVDALVMAATIRKTIDKAADVKPLYEKVVELDPERENIYQVLGKMYFTEGDMDNAFRVFSDMLARFPDSYVGHYYIGEIHGVKGDYDAAESAFLKALALFPDLDEARLELVKIYRLTGKTEKITEMYEEILERNPENILSAIELSLLYRTARPEKSKALLKALGERSLNDAGVVGAVLQYLVLRKRVDDAVFVIEGMAPGAPESPELHYAAGLVYFEKNQLEKALASFRAVPADSRFYKNTLMHMAIIHYKRKATDEGIRMLEQAMPGLAAEDRVELIPYLSSFYKEKGMMDAARDLIAEGLEIDPENTDLMFELGVIHDRQGNADQALVQMQNIVALDPDHADALNYIGYTYADQGIRLDEAEAMIQKAMVLKPDNGYIIDSLGWVYFQQGRLEEALTELLRAVSLIPDDPVVLEHLGDIYARLKDLENARKYYEKALAAPAADVDKLRKKLESLAPEENERQCGGE